LDNAQRDDALAALPQRRIQRQNRPEKRATMNIS